MDENKKRIERMYKRLVIPAKNKINEDIDLTYVVSENIDKKYNNNMSKKETKEKTFTLSKKQVNELEDWQGHIKAIYGEHGDYKYIFESGSGIGTGIKVYSNLANTSIDLTDYENF